MPGKIKGIPHQRKIIAITFVLILGIASLSLFPYAISYGIKQWLSEHGADQVTLHDVDFNPFTGILVLKNLNIQQENREPLAITGLRLQFQWGGLFQRQLIVDSLKIYDGHLLIEDRINAPVSIGGIENDPADQTTAGDDAVGWGFSVQRLALRNMAVKYKSAEIDSQLQLKKLVIDGLTNNMPEQSATMTLEGRLDDADLGLSGKINLFLAAPKFNGSLKLSGIRFERYAALMPPTIDQLNGSADITTDVRAQYLPATGIELSVTGRMVSQRPRLNVKALNKSVRLDRLGWAGKIDWRTRNTTDKLIVAGNLVIDGLKALVPDADDETLGIDHLELTDLEVNMQQKRLAQQQADAEIALSVSGRLAGQQSRLNLHERNTHMRVDALVWAGKIDWRTTTLADKLAAMGDLKLDGFKSLTADKAYTLLALDHLHAAGLQLTLPPTQQVQDEQVQPEQPIQQVQQLSLDGMMIGLEANHEDGQKAANLSHAAYMILDNVRYSNVDGLSIDRVSQTDAVYNLHKDEKGGWNYDKLRTLITAITSDADVPTTGSASKKDQAMPIHVGEFKLLGNSHVNFRDHQAEPNYRMDIKIHEGSLGKLDTRHPDQPSAFNVKGEAGNAGRFQFSGNLNPLAAALTLDIKGKIEGLALPPLSSYSKGLIGYVINTGKVDAEVTLKSENGKLSGNNKLTLQQLEVASVKQGQPKDQPKDKPKDKPQFDVQLDTGLAMLRDRQNNINLNLPISGDVDNIRMDPGDVINQALGKAIKQSARSYLNVALFPYGTILTVIEMAGEKAMQVKLDPIIYTPGNVNVSEDKLSYLSKVVTVLNDRPELQVKLCGVANEADRDALASKASVSAQGKEAVPVMITNKQLIQLAQERADGIETYLINTHQIANNRLISCQPRIDQEAESKPRTELTL